MREVVYSPESRIRHPGDLLMDMMRNLWASRELSWRLTVRDISAQYRQSLLGYFWAFVPPLAAALIFIVLNRQGVFNMRDTDIPYPAFVLFGTVLWQTFVESVNAPLKTVVASKSTLAKINFPYEALIISAIGQVLFSFSIKIIILVGVFVFYDVPITWGILLSVFAIFALILLGIAIGTLITPLGVLYSDFTIGLMTMMSLWFFVTPVVYPPPNSFPFSLVATANPVGPLLVGARDLATTGTLENAVPFFVVLGVLLTAVFFIWVMYRLSIPILIERMSA